MGRLAAPRPYAVRPRLSRGQMSGAVVAAGVGVACVALVDPATDGWFPSCPTRLASGVWCPACGLTRATHHVLNGDLVTAIRFNLFVVPVLLALALVAVGEVRRSLGHAGRSRVPPGWVAPVVAAVLIVYGVVRNLPSFGALRGV